MLSFIELVVILAATLGQPFASDLVRDRAVRLLRGVSQRAVFENGISTDLPPEMLQGRNGDAIDVVGSEVAYTAVPSAALPRLDWGSPIRALLSASVDSARSESLSTPRVRGPPSA